MILLFYTVGHCFTAGIHSEICSIRRFRPYANLRVYLHKPRWYGCPTTHLSFVVCQLHTHGLSLTEMLLCGTGLYVFWKIQTTQNHMLYIKYQFATKEIQNHLSLALIRLADILLCTKVTLKESVRPGCESHTRHTSRAVRDKGKFWPQEN